MTCGEAREYLSAIYDGERVPRQAAEHTVHCADCQELLKGYAEIGVILRSYGSLLVAQPVPERTWLTTRKDKGRWWKKGWQMMRIPRIALASLVLLLLVLGSRLALVEVRAHDDGSVLNLKLTPAQGDSFQCYVPITDTAHYHCEGLSQIHENNLFFAVKAIKKDGGRVLLSIRFRVTPIGPASYGPNTTDTLPETQSWFTPGETLTVPGTGELKLALTGEWTDRVPVGGNQLLDPGPNDIRLTSPLLLKNNTVVGDMDEVSAAADSLGEGAYFYVPGEGRFLLSSMPISGALPATVRFSRVSFESNGQKYVIVSGMPVSRAEKLWVLRDTAYKPAPDAEQGPMLGAGPISKLLLQK